MWPFKKKSPIPAPEDVSCDGMTASYDVQLKQWILELNGIEFNVSGVPFQPKVFDWVKEAAATIQALDDQIRARVVDCLEGWPCDQTKASILSVDLDEYETAKTMEVAFVGDESWGDFGVDVIISNGRIVDVYGGD